MLTAAQLAVVLKADTAHAEQGIARVVGMLGAGGPLAIGAAAGAIAVVGIAAAATKMAGDFQAGTETLVTGAGEAQSSLGMVRDGILKMAVDTGTSTQQLTDGMFMIDSAGYTAANGGLKVLANAAMGAKVGAAQLGTVADATTTIMKDFGLDADHSAQAVNLLIATVANGKTHMEDLGQSIAMIAPTAAAAHVSMYDMAGAMATMTGEGVPAANAATYLRQLIIALDAPSKQSAKALEGIGLSTKEVSAAMQKSLPSALELITTHLKHFYAEGSPQYVEALKAIAGGSRQMQGLLDLTGLHLQDFHNNVGKITTAVTTGGTSIAGWNEVQGEFNFKMERAKEVVETLMIKLGTLLLPVVGAVADAFVGLVGIISGIVLWFNQNSAALEVLKAVLAAVAIVTGVWAVGILVGLVPAFVAWAVSAGAAAIAQLALTWPILAVIAGIAALILIIRFLMDHWKQITDFIGQKLQPQLTGLRIGWDQITHAVSFLLGKLGDLLGVLGHVKDAAGGALGGLGSVLSHIPGFAEGGVAPGGLAVVGERGPEVVALPGGTRVYPSGTGPGVGGGSGGVIHVHVMLDGREIGMAAARYLPAAIRGGTGARDF